MFNLFIFSETLALVLIAAPVKITILFELIILYASYSIFYSKSYLGFK